MMMSKSWLCAASFFHLPHFWPSPARPGLIFFHLRLQHHPYELVAPADPQRRAKKSTMSKPFDYSKWDNIELSDDEDDVHPNIDRESW